MTSQNKIITIDAGLTNSAVAIWDKNHAIVDYLKTPTGTVQDKHKYIFEFYNNLLKEHKPALVVVEDFHPNFGKSPSKRWDSGVSKVHYTSEFLGHMTALGFVFGIPLLRVTPSAWKLFIKQLKMSPISNIFNSHEKDAIGLGVYYYEKLQGAGFKEYYIYSKRKVKGEVLQVKI